MNPNLCQVAQEMLGKQIKGERSAQEHRTAMIECSLHAVSTWHLIWPHEAYQTHFMNDKQRPREAKSLRDVQLLRGRAQAWARGDHAGDDRPLDTSAYSQRPRLSSTCSLPVQPSPLPLACGNSYLSSQFGSGCRHPLGSPQASSAPHQPLMALVTPHGISGLRTFTKACPLSVKHI